MEYGSGCLFSLIFDLFLIVIFVKITKKIREIAQKA